MYIFLSSFLLLAHLIRTQEFTSYCLQNFNTILDHSFFLKGETEGTGEDINKQLMKWTAEIWKKEYNEEYIVSYETLMER